MKRTNPTTGGPKTKWQETPSERRDRLEHKTLRALPRKDRLHFGMESVNAHRAAEKIILDAFRNC